GPSRPTCRILPLLQRALSWLAAPRQCSPAEFPCRSGQCVAGALRCDGDRDCRDGSDEEGCAVPPHEYLCGPGTCLNSSLVCNGHRDCADGSDEGGNCSVPCRLPCSHLCYPSPQGPRCQCTPGYRLAEDGVSCVDVDECKEQREGGCSQTCLNAPGSYSCGCLPGYLLEPDGHVCKLTGEPGAAHAGQDLLCGRSGSRQAAGLDSGKKGTLVKGGLRGGQGSRAGTSLAKQPPGSERNDAEGSKARRSSMGGKDPGAPC
uniref:Uncharacterized protein n=1 Tax=Nothoprocta perdicaria TaxID=30464 RepID=A0A8C7A5Y5_NOTPE